MLYNIVEILCYGKAAEVGAEFCLFKKGADEAIHYYA